MLRLRPLSSDYNNILRRLVSWVVANVGVWLTQQEVWLFTFLATLQLRDL